MSPAHAESGRGGLVPVMLFAPKMGWLKDSDRIVASGRSNALKLPCGRSATKTTRSVESQSEPLASNFWEVAESFALNAMPRRESTNTSPGIGAGRPSEPSAGFSISGRSLSCRANLPRGR